MDFDVDDALRFMLNTVARGKLPSSTKKLISYCQKEDPNNPAPSKLQKLDFKADAKQIKEAIELSFKTKKIPKSYSGFYFGLDGLNMPNGAGIQFGCSKRTDKSDTAEWAGECDLYPGDIPSPALAETYRIIEDAGICDYVVCLGYTGLALANAFESIDHKLALGGAKSRTVCWGFHDGDLFRLGLITSKGFIRQLPDLKKEKQHRAPKFKRPVRASKPGLVGWIQEAENTAYSEPELQKRAKYLANVAQVYASANELSAARTLLDMLIKLAKAGADLDDLLIQEDLITIEQIFKNSSSNQSGDFPSGLISQTTRYIRETEEKNSPEAKRAVEDALIAVRSNSKNARALAQKAKACFAKATDLSEATEYNIQQMLVEVLSRVGDVDGAEKIARAEDNLVTTELAEAQWRAGKIKAYRKSISLLSDDEESDSLFRLESLSMMQVRIGDVDGIKRSLKTAQKRGERIVNNTISSWRKTSTLCDLAKLAHLARAKVVVREFLDRAEEFARASDSNDSASIAWQSLTAAYLDIGDPENAQRCARRIPNRETRNRKIGELLTRRGQHAEAKQLLEQCRTIESRIDLSLWIARHLIDPK